MLFKVTGVDGRFWTDAVGPANVHSIFSRLSTPIRFYRITHNPYTKINGDGEKTYGLEVDGSEISNVDDEVSVNAAVARYVFPPFGITFLICALLQLMRMNRGKALKAIG